MAGDFTHIKDGTTVSSIVIDANQECNQLIKAGIESMGVTHLDDKFWQHVSIHRLYKKALP